MIGTILGNRYEIVEVIGSGGMAIVYKAKCRLLNRFVAIKMLREELKNDKEFVERFRVEAQSAASLNHHNIVSVYDVGQENGLDYFVMEYIDGMTLKELIQVRKLDWRTACEYAMGICSAIEHAHKKNIVHRDIKPHNIMITHDNVVKVTDFGIARAVSSSTIVRAGNVIGSVHYFSPEQACGGIVDFKSDIYSIGVVLYEMLANRLPFDAENPVAIAKMHVDNEVTPPSAIMPQVPESVSDIVLKAMAKQPMMRYQSVSAFAQDLKKVIVSPESVKVRDNDSTQFIPVVNAAKPPSEISSKVASEKPKKHDKATAFAWIIAGIVMVASIFVVAFAFYPNLFKGGNKIDVPKLVGMKYSDAVNQYEGASWKINLKDSKYSDEFDSDYIMEQNPDTGRMPENGVIDVIVSKGKSSITLNDYEGKDVNEVKAELNKIGIENISIEYDTHQTYPKNTVFKQSPGKGSVIQKGEKVTVYVSTGQKIEKVKVPALKGLSKESAAATLNAVGLEVGEVKEVPDNSEKGLVVTQAIAAETQVDAGTSISFSVSKGPSKPMSTPTTDPESTQPTQTPSAEQSPKPSPTPRAVSAEATSVPQGDR